MKSRASAISTVDQKRLRIGTFHNFCMWVLKAYGDKINMNREFTFISTAHQMHLLQSVVKGTQLKGNLKTLKAELAS